jgi:outer membrane receptor protein involved in Fe transport
VPANIFGANTMSQAAAAYVGTNSTVSAFVEQINAGASIDGQLGDYWGAGPIRVAAGVEYRKERSAQIFDSLTASGGTSSNALPNTSGEFDVKEAYGEIHVPILTDKPFFHNLEARAAGRVSRYSSVGTVYSYNYGGIYSPVPDITFRASVALATRAPNIGELFSGLAQTFPTGVTDPCTGVTATSNGTYDARCRQDPFVAANIAQNGQFTLTQSDQQGISGFNGGNPNLHEEKGHTFTAGVVINPKSIHALRNFSLTVDYTRTHITGAIVLTDRQIELNGCYSGSNPIFCSLITRRAATQGTNSVGALTFVNAFATNSGGILESAIDATATYRQGLGSYGTLTASLAYTHMLQGWDKALPNADKNYFAGEIGTPKDKFLATIDWTKGPLTLTYRGTFLGRSYLDDQFVYELSDSKGNPITNRHDPRARIGAYYMQDLQVGFDVGDHFNLYAGVNNLLNISPPPIYSNLPGDVTGTETDASDYDAIGRRFYVGVRLRF